MGRHTRIHCRNQSRKQFQSGAAPFAHDFNELLEKQKKKLQSPSLALITLRDVRARCGRGPERDGH